MNWGRGAVRYLGRLENLWPESVWVIPPFFYTVLPLLVFIALVAVVLPRHEPWADEAQAWELARSLGLAPLFARWLHFEMSPGLWHLLLHAMSAAGISFAGMHWLTAAIETAAVGVLLWRSPFPWPLRVMLPFGFFLAFQYALVARSYSLVPLLLFLLAAIWKRRATNPLSIAFVLALLANTCAQALTIAIGMAIILLIEFLQERRWRVPELPWLVASFVFIVLAIGLAIWCCRPPVDAPWVTATHKWSQSGHYSPAGLYVPEWKRWLALARIALHGRRFALRDALMDGVATPHFFAAFLWCSLVLFLGMRKMLRYLWPAVLIVFFGTFTRFSPYHQGLVWLLLIFLVWVTWPDRQSWRHRSVLVAFALCAAIQIVWTTKCVDREWRSPYAPAVAAAPLLAEYLARGVRVDALMPPPPENGSTPPSFFEVGMQPFFHDQPFANVSTRFWEWSGDAPAYRQFMEDTERKQAVVFAVRYQKREREDLARLSALGYRSRAKFCATNIYPHHFSVEEVCYEFLEPPLAGSPASREGPR